MNEPSYEKLPETSGLRLGFYVESNSSPMTGPRSV